MLTRGRLVHLLHYDLESGHFTNKVDRGATARAGQRAGGITKDGYIRIKIDGTYFMAHSLAFLYVEGKIPPLVDHKDCNPLNNAWSNLRPCDKNQNSRNRRLRKDSTTGIKGVKAKRHGFYEVRVGGNYIGCYKDLELAEFIAREVREKLHEEFARHE